MATYYMTHETQKDFSPFKPRFYDENETLNRKNVEFNLTINFICSPTCVPTSSAVVTIDIDVTW